MLTGEIRSQIDRIWDAFWSGGIANPLEVIEQITYLLFLRRLDDLHTLEEYFRRWARVLLPALVPGANVVMASNPLLSYIVSGALAQAGREPALALHLRTRSLGACHRAPRWLEHPPRRSIPTNAYRREAR